MKKDKKDKQTIEDVSSYILKQIIKDNFFENYLYDKTAFHAMVLNRSLHERVLQDRNRDEEVQVQKPASDCGQSKQGNKEERR